jgi:hypothetical protein
MFLASLVSLLLIILVFSVILYKMADNDEENSSLVVEGFTPHVLASNILYVKNEVELRNAVDNPVGASIVIAPTADIYLTNSALNIFNSVNVTLTIDSKHGVCKIFGATNNSTIIVEDGGVLILDGIIITHENDVTGNGITVNSGGTVIMYSGIISGNAEKNGGGVYNSGIFKLYGGQIFGNKAVNNGGGLYNIGDFEMCGGEITNNLANKGGGGVYNRGVFNRLGGVISDNKATRGYNWA